MKTLSALLLFFLTSPVWAEVYIPVKYRIENENPGYCTWASIETVCRHQKVKAGYGLKNARKLDKDFVLPWGEVVPKNFGRDEPVRAKLDSLGIRYTMHPSLVRDEEGIRQIKGAVSSGKGAIVAMWQGWPTTGECHVITIIDFNEDDYVYIDSNDVGKNYRGSRRWFETFWTGFVLTIEE